MEVKNTECFLLTKKVIDEIENTTETSQTQFASFDALVFDVNRQINNILNELKNENAIDKYEAEDLHWGSLSRGCGMRFLGSKDKMPFEKMKLGSLVAIMEIDCQAKQYEWSFEHKKR